MTQFYLVRHGTPDWSKLSNEDTLRGARRDFVPLSKQGIEETLQLSLDERIRSANIIISSPYTRALHTAAIIAQLNNIQLHVEYFLHEWLPDVTFQFEGCNRGEFESVVHLVDEYYKHGGIRPMYGHALWEERNSVRSRSLSVLERYLDYKSVVVVTHGMVIQSLTDVTYVPPCGVIQWTFPSDETL